MSTPADKEAHAPQAGRKDHGRGNASVKGAALWAAGSQYCLFVLQFVTSVIISRFFLRPEEVGLFSVAMAAALILSVIQDFGLTRYLGRHPTADEETVRSCTVIAVVFSLLLSLLILALAWPVSAFYGEPRLVGILALIAGSYLFSPWSIIPLALLGRRLDFRSTFAVNISGALANSVVALVLAALGFSAESLAWAMVANTIVRAVVAQVAWPTPIRLSLKISNARTITGFGASSTLLYLIYGIAQRTPDLIIGRILGMAAAGLFSRGAALAAHLHVLVAGAVSAIYYPAFARLRDEGEDLGPYYQRVVAAHGAIVWPAMALLAVLAEPVVLMLYGDVWAGAAPILAWVAIAECFFVAVPLYMDLPILLGRMRQLMLANVVDAALSVLTLIAGAMISIEAAAASRVGYGLCWFLLYIFWIQRLVGFHWPAMLKIYLASAVTALLTALPALWAVTMWRTPATLGFIGTGVAVCGSGAVWLAAIFLLRHPARDDLVGTAMHALGPLLTRLRPKHA